MKSTKDEKWVAFGLFLTVCFVSCLFWGIGQWPHGDPPTWFWALLGGSLSGAMAAMVMAVLTG